MTKILQRTWTVDTGWDTNLAPALEDAQLVFVFGARRILAGSPVLADLRRAHPRAKLIGCSTAGEIRDVRVLDDSIVATAVLFDDTRVRLASSPLAAPQDSRETGHALARQLLAPGLAHVFVISDGLHVNGSELVAGFNAVLPPNVGLTGGLAGDAAEFEQTLVVADDLLLERQVAAVGFYGSRLRVGMGSQGGWDQFGPSRTITRAENNVLFELDGERALEVYRRYLGPHAASLPASALRFPLSIVGEPGEDAVTRTVLGIDAEQGTMTFAGEIRRGAQARLMMANFERLIDGASRAADNSRTCLPDPADLAILISCVGRKLVLGQRTEEEVDSVRSVLGATPALAGFYSYGEISPFTPGATCQLQNQTMTITTFRET